MAHHARILLHTGRFKLRARGLELPQRAFGLTDEHVGLCVCVHERMSVSNVCYSFTVLCNGGVRYFILDSGQLKLMTVTRVRRRFNCSTKP